MIKPLVKVEALEMDDPTFEAGSSHTARALLTNPTTKQWTYFVELYLGVTKVVTSGVGTVTIPAGGSTYVDFTIAMPVVEGEYLPFLDISVVGELLAHYQATENVVIEISPAITVGPITWA